MADVLASPLSADPTPQPSLVLIVEDNDINREVAQAILEAAGHHVELVENGEEAVAAVQVREFDVVLMDIQMPVLDGVAATRQIRALAHPASAVPIIAMTASSSPHQVGAYFGAGMNGHVGKPFKRDELVAAVVRWSRRLAAEPPAPALLDLPTYEGVVAMIGAEKSQVLLDALAQQLAQMPTDIAKPLDRAAAGAGRARHRILGGPPRLRRFVRPRPKDRGSLRSRDRPCAAAWHASSRCAFASPPRSSAARTRPDRPPERLLLRRIGRRSFASPALPSN